MNNVLAAGQLASSTIDRIASRLAADPSPARLARARL
jgi:hypothetical protein